MQGSHPPHLLRHIPFAHALEKVGDGRCSGFISARTVISKKLLEEIEDLKLNIQICQMNCLILFCL